MNNGKYSKNNRKRRLRWSKQFVLLASIAVMLVGIIGGTLAYLTTSSGSVVNTFTPGNVDIEVDEPGWNDGGSVKSNVSIKNVGNVDAKIRAMIVVTWQKDGVIYPEAPVAGVDYEIKDLTGADWTQVGAWYEYGPTVAPNNATTYLFTSCTPVAENTPKGYHLVVDVIAEAIQAEGGAQW